MRAWFWLVLAVLLVWPVGVVRAQWGPGGCPTGFCPPSSQFGSLAGYGGGYGGFGGQSFGGFGGQNFSAQNYSFQSSAFSGGCQGGGFQSSFGYQPSWGFAPPVAYAPAFRQRERIRIRSDVEFGSFFSRGRRCRGR
jgi:hypothetical protein